MKVTYVLNVDDFVAFNVYALRQTRSMRRSKVMGLMIFFVGFAVVVPLAMGESPLDVLSELWWLLLIFLAMIAALLFIRSKAHMGWWIKRMLGSGRNAGLFGPRSLTIEELGLRDDSPETEAFSAWSAVERVVATTEHAFVFISAMQAFIVPRRAFADQDEYLRFMNDVAARAGVAVEVG